MIINLKEKLEEAGLKKEDYPKFMEWLAICSLYIDYVGGPYCESEWEGRSFYVDIKLELIDD